jgi:hypothetical protein
MFVCCECCVLSGRGLSDELITRPEESYRLWCVVVCDLETLRMMRPWLAFGRSATAKERKKEINTALDYDTAQLSRSLNLRVVYHVLLQKNCRSAQTT